MLYLLYFIDLVKWYTYVLIKIKSFISFVKTWKILYPLSNVQIEVLVSSKNAL